MTAPVDTSLARACVIGAGSSGIPVVKALADAGVPFDCFEKSDRVGGNWVFGNKNGMSSAYRSLHINTSRDRMQYADYPMPRDYPDFAHHSLVARYFDDYVDHFGLRRLITFGCGVAHVAREDGCFRVTLEDGRVRHYDAVIVANGHHWDPSLPTPPFPGTFDGVSFHSHHYVDPSHPHDLVGKRVVVLGMGNSAMDIACELGRQGVADKVFLAMRRGAWVIPHYLLGRPLDQSVPLPAWVPFRIKQAFGEAVLRVTVGDMKRYGLPEPDHRLGEAHPTISSELLAKLGRGDVVPKPNLARLDGRRVHFVDGSVEEVDAIVWCTGYKVTFPFFDPAWLSAKDNDFPLYRRTFRPDEPGLAFVGLYQPLGAIMPLAEAQAKWIADWLRGECPLPSVGEMQRDIERERSRMFARYVASRRHTMQVDFDEFLAQLVDERAKGRARARRHGYRLPMVPRAALRG